MDSKTKFSFDIENLKIGSGDVSYVEIISEYIEKHNIDPSIVPRLLTESLFQKIKADSIKLNHIEVMEDHYVMEDLL